VPSYPEVSGDFIVWGKVESRADPPVKKEDRDAYPISILLIPDVSAIRKLDMTGLGHQIPPYLPDKIVFSFLPSSISWALSGI
jgi:hypothetical protein